MIQSVAGTADIDAYQYYFDTDPGTGVAGNGAIVPVGPTSNMNSLVAIALPNTLMEGFHNLYIRTRNTVGSWSITERRPFLIQTVTSTDEITAYQYYFDTDPGVGVAGNGAVVPISPTSGYSATIAISLPNTLANGFHNLYVRTRNMSGKWSITERRLFIIQEATNTEEITAYQYYFDTDPGVGVAGNGAVVPVTPSVNFTGTVAISVPNTLSNGMHNLYIRARNTSGKWSIIERRMFLIQDVFGISDVAALEYYFDNDPGPGNGNNIPVAAAANILTVSDLGVPCLSTGTHYLYIRAKNSFGSWSIIEKDTVTITNGIAASVVSPAGPINICNGDSILLSSANVAGAAYQWLLGGNPIAGATGTTYYASASGNYSLQTTCGAAFATSNTVQVVTQQQVTYFADSDGDGYGDAANSIAACVQPAGYLTNSSDCNDTNSLIHPGATETCNNLDDDCDLAIDEGVTFTYFTDADSDGFGDPMSSVQACVQPMGYVANNSDCDDTNASINPTAAEVCNGVDDDCDSMTDEGVTSIYFADIDGDGYGNAFSSVQACTQPSGYVIDNTDCNDGNGSVWQDNTFYIDQDSDSYDNGTTLVCYGNTIPTGYITTTLGTDCNDNDATVQVPIQYFVDSDQDGYGSAATAMVCASVAPLGYSTNSTDCNDLNAAINAGVAEVCNGTDDDCDLMVDDADPNVTGRPVWYADTDQDGFGDPASATPACIQPAGYITDNTDCDDTDSDEHPGQVWYTDNDGDEFGTGATVIQCLRPANGYLATELISTTGDCNDNNPNIHPAAQTLTFSGSPNFGSSLANPLSGTSYTNFTFEVLYTDATNALPPPTFPRVILDYEGNGVFNNGNDRVVIMNPYDVSDLNTSDGKRYIGSINSLPAGSNWQTRIQIVNGSCITQIGPFNYPDVLVLPDLQIFANDITFSSPNPAVSSPQTVTAVIHNVSDFAAQNFYVHLVNQYDNLSPADILVNNLPANSSQTIQWTITTPAVPAWCPIQVSVDYTNVIDESNELDNSALRPFINGNFNLPGGIVVVNAATSPSVSYSSTGAITTISGRGLYYGTPVPMADSSVAGGTVTFTVIETGATFTTTTNSLGYFSLGIPTPLATGTYHVTGSLTDFTLTGTFATSYTVLPQPACLPDMRASVSVSSNYIVQGNSISGTLVAYNYGCVTTGTSTILDVSQTGGSVTLNDITVPALAPGASYSTPFSGMVFNTPGTYSICATADGTFLVAESNESNNTDCELITVIPAIPDIYPNGGPGGNIYICQAPGSASFSVGNAGGAPTGPFNCEVIIRENNVVIGTVTQAIANIPAFGTTGFSIPVAYTLNTFTFELRCDVPHPNGTVVETNENNNTGMYGPNILDCRPDLVLGNCESFDVAPVDPQFPGTVTYTATMSNTGNATANGPIYVRFQLSGGTIYNTQYNSTLAPGQSTVVSVTVPSIAPATQTLTATADPDNNIVEWNEANSVSNSLCWDFQPVPMYGPCGSNFWDNTYLINQTAFLSVGLRNHHMYDASQVKVRFQVSGPGLSGTITLGDAVVNNVEQTCNCPRTAVLPISFVFPQTGVYTFTMTADPDAEYTECLESNNVLVVQVTVTALPDMRVLSQFIDPSMLNPQPGQSITMDITYDNIGYSNIIDQMELKVLVDEVPLDSVYPVGGLVSGDNITIAIPASWSSAAPGTHVIRAIIDNDNQVTETNELNNQATRAVIVGEAANLYFQLLASGNPTPALHDNININARIGNNGDLDCDADVQFYYLTNALDTIHIGTIPVSVDDNDSVNISLPWFVLDPATTIIARIVNASTLEFTYDDNEAATVIGAMNISFASTQSCNGNAAGTLTANIAGGEGPFAFLWYNGFNAGTLTGSAGTYSVVVTDATGQTATGSGTIFNDPGVTYYADADSDGYGNAAVTQISCAGAPAGYVSNDDDCDDSNSAVNPAATEVCNNIDDDCDGLLDNNDPSLSDTELPAISCVSNINVYNDVNTCGAVVTYAMPTFSDNCLGATIAQTGGLASGSVFPVGTTTNTFTVTDFSNNTASCSFDVIVIDAQSPAISCPADISLIATSAAGAVVTYAAPTGTDNCAGATTIMTAGLASGSTFPIGITTVTYQVTDAANQVSTCSFTVHVTGLPPQIVCPTNITVNNTAGQCGTNVVFAATETTGIPASTISYSHISGDFYPVGTTTVTATAVNPVGTSSCTFDIVVLDNENPTLTLPSDIVVNNDAGQCGAVVNYAVSHDDNCAGESIAQSNGLTGGSFFPIGTTTNAFTVTDAAGNSVSGSFTVTVLDATNPEVTCPANIVVSNDAGICGATVTYNIPFSDNCSGASILQTSGLASGSVFPVGITTNTFVVTDASGNSSTCSFSITVNDTENPVISCSPSLSTPVNTLGCLANVTYSMPSFSDNCPGATITQTAGLPSGADFPLGTTTNTFVVTDASGNTATCSFNVTITNSKPVVTSVLSSAGPIFPVSTATTLTAVWTDELAGGPYTVTFIWNDGTANTVLTGVSGFTASATHTYNTSAVFEPSIRVTDACGNQSNVVSGVSTYQYLAVYVVGSQFTTMGGWYNTPAGSYMAQPAFNGRVNMGNVVKPVSGVFKGELELNINDYNLKVHAVNPTTWDYLTISGCCFAQFRGSCKVNNVTGYKVLVAQTDINYSCGAYGGNNLIRVKVWNSTTGQVIYDTQPGDPDNALPTLPLNGGAIQVHTQGNCQARIEKPEFDFNCFPNPANDVLNFDILSDQEQQVEIRMFDMTGKIVHNQQLNTAVGSNTGIIEVARLVRGVYFVEINAPSGIRRVKVVLE
jgi:hypothetical protein